MSKTMLYLPYKGCLFTLDVSRAYLANFIQSQVGCPKQREGEDIGGPIVRVPLLTCSLPISTERTKYILIIKAHSLKVFHKCLYSVK